MASMIDALKNFTSSSAEPFVAAAGGGAQDKLRALDGRTAPLQHPLRISPLPRAGRRADRHIEVADEAVRQRIDPAMDRKILPALPRLLHEHVGGDVPHLAHYVELAEAIEPRLRIGDAAERFAVLVAHFADRVQPVIDEAAPLSVDRRGHAAAA